MSSEKVNVNYGANATIQHSVYSGDKDRRECVGMALEIIKTCASAGMPKHYVEEMIDSLDEYATKIQAALRGNSNPSQ